MDSEELIQYLKESLEYYLNKINATDHSEFRCGEKTAYVECLEILKKWKHSDKIGLDYDIEKRYPL